MNSLRLTYLLCFLATLIATPCWTSAASIKNIEVVEFSDNGEVLNNPGMGWVIYYYANSLKYYAENIDHIDDQQLLSFPGLSVVAFRMDWSHLEPEENNFNWDLIDKPAKRFLNLGLKISIRVANSENFSSQPYATPKWVFNAGAKEVRFKPGYPGVLDANGDNREPDFDDPIFLQKLDAFVKQLAKKYDDPEKVAFVDIGSFGVYGEGHTWSSTKKAYSESVLIKHIDIYKKYFKNVPLIINHNFADHLQDKSKERNINIIKYAAQENMGLRDDSILIDKGKRAYYDEKMAEFFCSKQVPIILETGEYSSRLSKGYWDPDKIREAINAYHASYMSAYWYPLQYLRENKKLINSINRNLGYRLVFDDVEINSRNSILLLNAVVKNVGVGYVQADAFLKIDLFSNGKKIFSKTSDMNLKYSVSACLSGVDRAKYKFIINMEKFPIGRYQACASLVDTNGKRGVMMPHANSTACGSLGYSVGSFDFVRN